MSDDMIANTLKDMSDKLDKVCGIIIENTCTVKSLTEKVGEHHGALFDNQHGLAGRVKTIEIQGEEKEKNLKKNMLWIKTFSGAGFTGFLASCWQMFFKSHQ